VLAKAMVNVLENGRSTPEITGLLDFALAGDRFAEERAPFSCVRYISNR
jgi:hypothetical protein